MSGTPRVFHDATPREGEPLTLDPDEARHVAKVLRLSAGDAVRVFDGRDGEWDATIESVSRAVVRLRIGAPLATPAPDPALRIDLFQSIVRPERLEWTFQKGTEIGVRSFRLISPARAERAKRVGAARAARWQRIAREATKQCGRRRVPDIEPHAPFPLPVPAGVFAALLDPRPETSSFTRLLNAPRPEQVWLAVGPEGGFRAEEADAARDAGWVPARLGPRTLRAETAGIVAAALVLSRWGDFAG